MPAKWQLAQMFFGAGCHLPKRVRKMREMYVVPIDDSWVKNSRGAGSGFKGARGYSFASYCNLYEPMIPYGHYHNRVYIGSRISGNLPLEEYRFYLGHSVAISEFSQCRVCLSQSTLRAKGARRAQCLAGLLWTVHNCNQDC